MDQVISRQLLSPKFGVRLQSALVGFVKGKLTQWQVLLLICFNFYLHCHSNIWSPITGKI